MVNLTSLRVFNLSNTRLYSIPTYMGKHKIVEFLTLSHLPIRNLEEDTCHLCRIQFVNLSYCGQLESFPYQIGQIKICSYLNLSGCLNLELMLCGIYKLIKTSVLCVLLISRLRVKALWVASIWSLKGLKNITHLDIKLIMKPRRD